MLDSTKKIFVNDDCYRNDIVLKYILQQLDKLKFPESNIIRGLDLNAVSSGDYLVRSVEDNAIIYQLEYIGYNLITKCVGQL